MNYKLYFDEEVSYVSSKDNKTVKYTNISFLHKIDDDTAPFIHTFMYIPLSFVEFLNSGNKDIQFILYNQNINEIKNIIAKNVILNKAKQISKLPLLNLDTLYNNSDVFNPSYKLDIAPTNNKYNIIVNEELRIKLNLPNIKIIQLSSYTQFSDFASDIKKYLSQESISSDSETDSAVRSLLAGAFENDMHSVSGVSQLNQIVKTPNIIFPASIVNSETTSPDTGLSVFMGSKQLGDLLFNKLSNDFINTYNNLTFGIEINNNTDIDLNYYPQINVYFDRFLMYCDWYVNMDEMYVLNKKYNNFSSSTYFNQIFDPNWGNVNTSDNLSIFNYTLPIKDDIVQPSVIKDTEGYSEYNNVKVPTDIIGYTYNFTGTNEDIKQKLVYSLSTLGTRYAFNMSNTSTGLWSGITSSDNEKVLNNVKQTQIWRNHYQYGGNVIKEFQEKTGYTPTLWNMVMFAMASIFGNDSWTSILTPNAAERFRIPRKIVKNSPYATTWRAFDNNNYNNDQNNKFNPENATTKWISNRMYINNPSLSILSKIAFIADEIDNINDNLIKISVSNPELGLLIPTQYDYYISKINDYIEFNKIVKDIYNNENYQGSIILSRASNNPEYFLNTLKYNSAVSQNKISTRKSTLPSNIGDGENIWKVSRSYNNDKTLLNIDFNLLTVSGSKDGEDAITCVSTNDSDSVSININGKVKEARTIDIEFLLFKGSASENVTSVTCDKTNVITQNGGTFTINKNVVKIILPKDFNWKLLSSTDSVKLTFDISYSDGNIKKVFILNCTRSVLYKTEFKPVDGIYNLIYNKEEKTFNDMILTLRVEQLTTDGITIIKSPLTGSSNNVYPVLSASIGNTSIPFTSSVDTESGVISIRLDNNTCKNLTIDNLKNPLVTKLTHYEFGEIYCKYPVLIQGESAGSVVVPVTVKQLQIPNKYIKRLADGSNAPSSLIVKTVEITDSNVTVKDTGYVYYAFLDQDDDTISDNTSFIKASKSITEGNWTINLSQNKTFKQLYIILTEVSGSTTLNYNTISNTLNILDIQTLAVIEEPISLEGTTGYARMYCAGDENGPKLKFNETRIDETIITELSNKYSNSAVTTNTLFNTVNIPTSLFYSDVFDNNVSNRYWCTGPSKCYIPENIDKETCPIIWCIENKTAWINVKENGVNKKIEIIQANHWSDAYQFTGSPGSKGDTPPATPIIYPAGEWKSNETYTFSSQSTPYVIYRTVNGNKYYVCKKTSTGQIPSSNSTYWQELEKFDAVYANIGIINNGKFGSAVFSGNYMFSQYGTLKTYNNGSVTVTDVIPTTGSTGEITSVEYEKFNTDDPFSSPTTENPERFIPSWCVNLLTGEEYMFNKNIIQTNKSITFTSSKNSLLGLYGNIAEIKPDIILNRINVTELTKLENKVTLESQSVIDNNNLDNNNSPEDTLLNENRASQLLGSDKYLDFSTNITSPSTKLDTLEPIPNRPTITLPTDPVESYYKLTAGYTGPTVTNLIIGVNEESTSKIETPLITINKLNTSNKILNTSTLTSDRLSINDDYNNIGAYLQKDGLIFTAGKYRIVINCCGIYSYTATNSTCTTWGNKKEVLKFSYT